MLYYPTYYCQQVGKVLCELYPLIKEMADKHYDMIPKVLSEKMADLMEHKDSIRDAITYHFKMAAYLDRSYGYLKCLVKSGICPPPAQLKDLVDLLEKMEKYHKKMKEEMDDMKKKYKGKMMDNMEEMESMHERIRELTNYLKKFY